MSTDQCAQNPGPDGSLKDEKDTQCFHDKDDAPPLPSVAALALPLSSGLCNKATNRLFDAVAREQLGSDEEDQGTFTRPPRHRHAARASNISGGPTPPTLSSRNSFENLPVEECEKDGDFQPDSGSESDNDSADDSTVLELIFNNELPRNTAVDLSRGNRKQLGKTASHKRKAARVQSEPSVSTSKRARVTVVEGIPDEQVDGPNAGPSMASIDSLVQKPARKKRNPIYHFYESVSTNSQGQVGNFGDKHYKCYHGNRKVITVTRAMKYSLNGLVGHLKTHFSAMHRLYLIMKDRTDPPTDEELAIASGKKVLDEKAAKSYLGRVKAPSANLVSMFAKQPQENAEKVFDMETFERHLAEWVVASDQPFEEVERPEFRCLLGYTYMGPKPLNIPHRTVLKDRIMKMGKSTVKAIQKLVKELDANISLSLDMWTSSNGHAFLAIVMHWINNDWKLEELFIDFRELVGVHSGENLAHAVYDTLNTYGLKGRVVAINMDNALNNDTMIEHLEALLQHDFIDFNPSYVRMRCMPHIVHLAALELLKAIGVVKDDKKYVYQDSVTAPLSREHDNDASGDTEELDENMAAAETLGEVLTAIPKLRNIIRAVRSSPQRQEAWLEEANAFLRKTAAAFNVDLVGRPATMPILDVKTQWSSTHQMLRRAMDYRAILDDFVSKHRDLHKYELQDEDWDAVALVSQWLKLFRSATTQMLTTKRPMLSSTHAIFRGLQDSLTDSLRSLPNNTPALLRQGLLNAHRKLSDYYGKFDESPYYTWASLLDPRISYCGLLADCGDDLDARAHLETAKESLYTHFRANYDKLLLAPTTPVAPTSTIKRSPQEVDFTSRYRNLPQAFTDEVQEYFKLPREDFDTCDPLQWWAGRRSQFPNLSCFARDILSIPGSAVAVERIFSSSRETISLCCARLDPETIGTRMLVKQQLSLARTAVHNDLKDL